jgi:beta-lactamase regulating signal transducer with metallopeptidase domain
MTALDFHPVTQVFAERLLYSAVAGSALAVLLYLLLRTIGRQNSGTRFAIWFSALLAMIGFPFFSGSAFYSSSFHGLSANLKGEIVLSSAWAEYLFFAWGAVAAILLCRIGVGLWRVREVRNNCLEIDLAGIDPAIAEIFRTATSRRPVMLCVSKEVSVPSAIGLFRPAIVFPDWLWPQLSAAEIAMIARHELAHLERWDDWTNLVQKIVKAALFFHPAVWWIENRLTLEREMACDDMVLAQIGNPRAYASSLISFAEKLQSARGLALAQAWVSRMHEMSVRLAQILDAKRSRRLGLWKPVVALSAGVLVFALAAAPYLPRLVAFENPSASQSTTLAASSQWNGRDAAPGRLNADVSPRMAQPVTLQRNVLQQAAAIQAVFHPRVKAAPRLKAATPKTPLVLRASVREDTAKSAVYTPAIYILQTAEYDAPDAASPGVWTFCIWKIDANNPADRQLESAIVVSWI